MFPLATEVGLAEDEVRVLAAIAYRGEQPKTAEDWRFLYQAIRHSVRGPD